MGGSLTTSISSPPERAFELHVGGVLDLSHIAYPSQSKGSYTYFLLVLGWIPPQFSYINYDWFMQTIVANMELTNLNNANMG